MVTTNIMMIRVLVQPKGAENTADKNLRKAKEHVIASHHEAYYNGKFLFFLFL